MEDQLKKQEEEQMKLLKNGKAKVKSTKTKS